MLKRPLHPLEHHPAFRAVIDAAPPLAQLAAQLPRTDLVGPLVIASSDLASGFAAPPDSKRRVQAHQRAWARVREIDRRVAAAARRRLAPAELVQRAQHAVDRADVLIGALLPS